MAQLDELRALGLPMVSRYASMASIDTHTQTPGFAQRFISWTTDADTAEAAKALGATVIECRARDARFDGWEVSCRVVEFT